LRVCDFSPVFGCHDKAGRAAASCHALSPKRKAPKA
jgi:hypothetical protein